MTGTTPYNSTVEANVVNQGNRAMNNTQPYESTGRIAQKARTRKALVDAARALIDDGITPTVEDAAAAASIARTTAYRYFPNQRELLVAAYPEMEQRSLLGANPPEDVGARLEVYMDEYLRQLTDNEAALRAALRLALDPVEANREQLVVRQGRAISWLKEVLEPLRERLSEPAIEHLVLAIRSATGIEAMIWLCDVAHLSREEAREILRWSAHALLRAALLEANGHSTRTVAEPEQQVPSGQPGT